jgi:hypothetical protein
MNNDEDGSETKGLKSVATSSGIEHYRLSSCPVETKSAVTTSKTILFSEKQHSPFWQKLALMATLAALGWIGYRIWTQIVNGQPFVDDSGGQGGSSRLLGLILAGMIAIIAVLAANRNLYLETEVRPEGIRIRFSLFHRRFRFFPINEVLSCREIQSKSRIGFGNGRIHLSRRRIWRIGGHRAVLLELSNQPLLLIGSRRPEEFARAVEAARQKVRPGRWS